MSLIGALKEVENASPRMREVVEVIAGGGSWSWSRRLLAKFNWLAKDDHEAAQLLWQHLGHKHLFRMRRAPKSKQKDLFRDGNGDTGGGNAGI